MAASAIVTVAPGASSRAATSAVVRVEELLRGALARAGGALYGANRPVARRVARARAHDGAVHAELVRGEQLRVLVLGAGVLHLGLCCAFSDGPPCPISAPRIRGGTSAKSASTTSRDSVRTSSSIAQSAPWAGRAELWFRGGRIVPVEPHREGGADSKST